MVWSLLTAAVPLAQTAPLGPYTAWWKFVPLVLLMLVWGRLVTWIDKDSQEVLLPRTGLNLGNLIGGIVGFALFFLLPNYALGVLALFLIVGIEAGVYLAMRNSKAGLGDLGGKFNEWMASVRGGEKEVKAVAGEVLLMSKSGAAMPAPAAEDPVRPAYEAAQSLFTDPLRRNAERIDLAPAEGQSTVRYTVDGVGYAGNAIERGRAAAGIEYIKSLAGMNVEEKRKPQTGTLKLSLDGQKHELQISTAGSSAGEQLRAIVNPKKKFQQKLDDLGMTEDQLEITRAVIQDMSGIVLVSTPKGQGLTTLLYAILRAHDAFLQHIHTVEPDQATDLEGITQNKIAPNAPVAEELDKVRWIISQEPDIIMHSKVEDPKVAVALSKFAGEGRRVYVGMRANSTFDALNAWRKLIGDDRAAVNDLRMIVTGRVLRRLCAACKAGYSPDPGTLRKLNMDPDKIEKLYQARTQPMRDAKGNPVMCDFCKELYFKGRIGVYELFMVDEDVRTVVENGGSVNQLKAAFRKQRGKYLQEAALAQVESGETSVQEVLRVMKSGDDPSGGAVRSKPRQPAV
ncbi:MAG TPA: ATPase, T2SS/T4P/T4SS family [Tepidisphaeraceae bacterium]|nr:ATPase, T2SS/T4P/T4SS family [Tepidisphaeraceae bacterium]